MSHSATRTLRRPADSGSHESGSAPARKRRAAPSSLAFAAPFVQTKLEVNTPGDAHEQQAERVANSVMRSQLRSPMPATAPMPPPDDAPSLQRAPIIDEEQQIIKQDQDPRAIQRAALQDEEKEIIKQDQDPRSVQRAVMPEDQTIQRDGGGMHSGKPSVNTKTAATIRSPGPGSPMPTSVRSRIEPHVGANLSHVRVHTDARAAQAASSLQARAFTHQHNIFLNKHSSIDDVHLMAHESTHVVQQGALLHRMAMPTPEDEIQRAITDWVPDVALNELNSFARQVPGYTLFTVILGFNPILGTRVERNAMNMLEGLMGLAPFGTLIFDKLREHGIIQAAFDWVEGQLNRLDLSLGRIERTIQTAWSRITLLPGYFDENVEILRQEFGALYNDVVTFVNSLIDHIIDMITEAAIGIAEGLLNENRAWALIKKVIKYDPLRDQPVQATTVEILEDFLMLIGKQTELEQMRERGTLQETAAWLDTQIATFMSLVAEFRALFTAAWDAIQPQNLADLPTNLRTLASNAGDLIQRAWDFAVTVAVKVLELVKNALLAWLATFANEIPGYHLLTVILEKDVFTQQVVPRTATNLIRGFMSLMPDGEAKFQQMSETGVIPQAAQRIETLMTELGISWPFVRDLFLGIWNSLTIEDLVHPLDAFTRITAQFGEPISRLFRFVVEVIKVIIELVLHLMNFPSELLGNIINNATQAIDDIKRDPVAFLMNLLQTVKLGFTKFFDNILTHLMNGLVNWLFGQLQAGGIQPPTDLSFASILNLVLQILGLTTDHLWEKLGEHIGAERVAQIRRMIDRLTGIWNFIRDVQERGVVAIWEYVESQLSNLWTMVLDQVKNWIMERIITRVTARLLSMLDPTGIMAVVNSFMVFFNAVQSAIEYFRQMLEIVDKFVSTVAAIARGDTEPGAARMERALADAIPVAIGFLANQVGLGGLSDRIREIIQGIRGVVDQAIDWLISRALSLGRAILNALGFGGGAAAGAAAGTPTDTGVQFDAEHEHHRLWVDFSAAQPRVMVASDTPTPVPTLLDHFEARIPTLTPVALRPEATQVIARARTQYTTMQERATNARRSTPTTPQLLNPHDNPRFVSAESNLSESLRRIFEIFHGSRAPSAGLGNATVRAWFEITVRNYSGTMPSGPTDPSARGSGRVMGPQPGLAGATNEQRLPVMTRNTSDTLGAVNSDHAEHMFIEWISAPAQAALRASIVRLDVRIRDLSPCRDCAAELASLLSSLPNLEIATLSWSEPYITRALGDRPLETRPGDLERMVSAGWNMSPGPGTIRRAVDAQRAAAEASHVR